MSKFDKLPRGFKAKAERVSLKYRSILGLEKHQSMCGFDLSEQLKIEVCTPAQFFGKEVDLSPLVGDSSNSSGWSALTMKGKSGKKIIIHNPNHPPTRQQSDLMHELAHSICKHEKPARLNGMNLPFFMREHDEQQEQEAIYLGGALQIPREGLVWCKKRRMSMAAMAAHFNASVEMVRFRVNVTGVNHQFRWQR